MLSLLLLCLLGLLFHWRRRNGHFARLGLSGPPPTLGLGNLWAFRAKSPMIALRDWGKSYGPTFGYFEGTVPVIVTADPDVVQEIWINQFSSWPGRSEFPLAPDPDTAKQISIVSARGLRWKRLRAISSPVFTAAKLRLMQPFVHGSLEQLIDVLDARAAQGSFDVYPYFRQLTLDVIAKVAFGFDAGVLRGENAELMRTTTNAHPHNLYWASPLSTLACVFPRTKPLLRWLNSRLGKLRPKPQSVLMSSLSTVLRQRRAHPDDPQRLRDFIDLMLEAETPEDFLNDVHTGGGAIADFAKKLTTEEVVVQMLTILIAGFDTTATALALLFFELARHPEVQEKLHAELASELGREEAVTVDAVAKLPYLEQVIQEGLRLYPHGSVGMMRESVRESVVRTRAGTDLRLPKGQRLTVDVWGLHRILGNKEIWGRDADVFRPERMETEGKHPMANLAFGAGPRICLGKRLALVELRLTVARLVLRYTVRESPLAPAELSFKGNAFTQPHEAQVLLEPRK